jgi:hypothetical protein
MTYDQNVFGDDSTNTVTRFWIVIGSATGFFIVMGIILLSLIAKYGAAIHKFATTIFGSAKKEVASQSSDEQRADSETKPLVASNSSGASAASAESDIRRRKPTVRDEEQGDGNSTGGGQVFEMTAQAGGSRQRAGEGVV